MDKGSPSEEAGLQVGDQIMDINGHSFVSIFHQEAVYILRSYPTIIMTIKVSCCANLDVIYCGSLTLLMTVHVYTLGDLCNLNLVVKYSMKSASFSQQVTGYPPPYVTTCVIFLLHAVSR